MDPRHRDGLLAAVGLVVLLVASRVTGDRRSHRDPAAIAVGVGGALLLEATFVRYAARLLPLWNRRGVPTASLLAVLSVGILGGRRAPRVAMALVWGLLTYLALLAVVLAGLWRPPASATETDQP